MSLFTFYLIDFLKITNQILYYNMTAKKSKIYISLPIAGKEDTVYNRNYEAIEYIKKNYPNYDYISPIDLNHIDNEALGNHLELDRTAFYMGRDIEQVILCDAILMCEGWENSKGCNVEKFTAEVYNKSVIFMK